MNLTLRARYTLTVIGLIAALSLALYLTLQWRSFAAIESITNSSTSKVAAGLNAEAEKRAASLARYLAEAMENPLYKLHLNVIGDLMETAARQPGVTFVTLIDTRGKILHDGTETIKAYGKPLTEKRVLELLRRPRAVSWTADAAYAASPVVLGAEVLGVVYMGLSLQEAHANTRKLRDALLGESNQARHDLIISAVLVAGLFLIFGVAACAVLVRHLTQPIQELSALAHQIGAGGQGATVELSRQDEIGVLAQSLNGMSLRLQETTVSRDYLDNILDSMLDPLLVLKVDGTIELANAAAANMLEYPSGKLVGESIHSFIVRSVDAKFGTCDNENSLPFVSAKLRKWQVTEEVEIRTASGTLIPVMIASAGMITNKDQGEHVVWVARDITDRKRMENSLVEERNKADLSNRAKSEFLANMSHELRTPLNSIIGFSELMSGDVRGFMTVEKYREFSADILDSGQYLLDLINKILDLSKIDAGKFDIKEEFVNVTKCIERSWHIVIGRRGAHPVEFAQTIIPKGLTLRADGRRIQQILINLMSNALKFTPDDGKITVAMIADESDCRITVADTGVGIKKEDIEKVLSPFGQIDNSYQRKSSGIGLGLPLTIKLVEMHDGTLSISSVPGQGTTVEIIFPKARVVSLGARERQAASI
jgi:PAS domain S-box-containing protein